MDKILKQIQQMNEKMSADLTVNMNSRFEKIDAKFEQITANAEINIAELTFKIKA